MKILSGAIAASLLLSIFSTSIAFAQKEESGNLTFKVVPQESLDPGEKYEVTAIVRINGNKFCQSCSIEWTFEEWTSEGLPQPGDELIPLSNTTNENGKAAVTAISYAPNRHLTAKVTLPDESLLTNSVLLPYKEGNPLLVFMKLVASVIKKGYGLPPLGNILAKATHQVYSGGTTREIFLEWNSPFGTRRFDVIVHHLGYTATGRPKFTKTYLAKTTKDTKTSVEVAAFEDLFIDVKACTSGNTCVDSVSLKVPKISATQSGTLTIPNFGLPDSYEKYEKNLKEEESFLDKFFKPVRSWLEGIYRLL